MLETKTTTTPEIWFNNIAISIKAKSKSYELSDMDLYAIIATDQTLTTGASESLAIFVQDTKAIPFMTVNLGASAAFKKIIKKVIYNEVSIEARIEMLERKINSYIRTMWRNEFSPEELEEIRALTQDSLENIAGIQHIIQNMESDIEQTKALEHNNIENIVGIQQTNKYMESNNEET